MAATVLTLALTFIVGGLGWLVMGARFQLTADPERNDLLNLMVYVGALLPVIFVLVFFVVERL